MSGMELEMFAPTQYDIADWPACVMHFKHDETSGTAISDEVRGIIYDVADTGTVTHGAPPHTVTIYRTGPNDLAGIGSFPTFSAGSYVYLFLTFRSLLSNGLPSGSNSMGDSLLFGTRQGAHVGITADDETTISGGIDAAKTITAGVDYLMLLAYRPTTSPDDVEGLLYKCDGSLEWIEAVANTTITPEKTITGSPTIGGIVGAGYWHQGNVYQWIAYEFATEQTDLAQAIGWHLSRPLRGDKSPFPGWKGRT